MGAEQVGRLAADVDGQDRAGRIRRYGAGKEGDGMADLPRGGGAAERHVLGEFGPALGIAEFLFGLAAQQRLDTLHERLALATAAASGAIAAPLPMILATAGAPATGLAEKFAWLSSSEPGVVVV